MGGVSVLKKAAGRSPQRRERPHALPLGNVSVVPDGCGGGAQCTLLDDPGAQFQLLLVVVRSALCPQVAVALKA